MSSLGKVAVVTGSNKGIGFFIAKKLAEAECAVVMACRDQGRMDAAISEIRATVPTATLTGVCCDVADEGSVVKAAAAVRALYPAGVNILVNNAGFAFKVDATDPFGYQAKVSIGINYFGVLAMTTQFLPLMVQDGNSRIVTVGSRAGELGDLKPNLVVELTRPDLSVAQLTAFMNEFIDLATAGTHQDRGWKDSAYGASKTAANLLSAVLARDPAFLKIQVNACCPGWCRTDMAGMEATSSAEEGADTPVWLALQGAGSTGKFFAERKEIPF